MKGWQQPGARIGLCLRYNWEAEFSILQITLQIINSFTKAMPNFIGCFFSGCGAMNCGEEEEMIGRDKGEEGQERGSIGMESAGECILSIRKYSQCGCDVL